jgi:hypothetical protein
MANGPGRHEISREQAKAYLGAWQRGRAQGAVLGGYLDRDVLDKILAQPGCVGVRYYNARHPEGRDTIVLVGVDAQEQDLWDGTIAEELLPCPPHCAPNSLTAE